MKVLITFLLTSLAYHVMAVPAVNDDPKIDTSEMNAIPKDEKVSIRVRPRFFNQVGHQTTNASIGNKCFSTKKCQCQTYQNYEQSRQKLGTFLVNKVL